MGNYVSDSYNVNRDYLNGTKSIPLPKGHIYSNNGSYRVEYFCCGKKAKTKTFKRLEDAEAYLDKMIKARNAFCDIYEIRKRDASVNEMGIIAIMNGLDPFEVTDDIGGKIHFDKYCEDYIQCCLIPQDRTNRTKKGLSTDTYSRRISDVESICKRHIKGSRIGGIPIGELTREDFYIFMKMLHDVRHLKYKTVQNIIQFCSQVLSFAREEGRIKENWANPKISQTALAKIYYSDVNSEFSGVRKSAYTEEESQKLIKAAKSRNYVLGVMVQFLIQTGARREEALGVKFSDIDRDKKDIHICRSVSRRQLVDPSRHGGKKTAIVCEESLKTTGSNRFIAVNDELLDELASLRSYLQRERGIINPEFCFTKPNGDFIDPDSVLNFVKASAADADIRQLTVHELRHTYATNTLKNTHDINYDSRQLGHSSLSTTRGYIHELVS